MIKEIKTESLPGYLSDTEFRIIMGPEANRFKAEGIKTFLTSEYTVTDQSDRMGYRLSGNIIKHKAVGADIISAGISPGTIQVPSNGQPIILMADRQTTGGYTRIANIITADLTLAAQLKPGDKVRFREINVEEAHDLLKQRNRLIENIFR
jgi:biotin-dependent carboxylase-like uncharacterized protein